MATTARAAALVLVVAGLVGAATAGCSRGDGSGIEEVARLRESQARAAAADAGLGSSVQDFFGQAARAPSARFSATYVSGADRIVVHQVPPRRRVDVVAGGVVREAVVVAEGEAPVRCDRPAGSRWTCTPDPAADAGVGAFSPELVARTVEALADGASSFRTEVVDARIAGVRARCLQSTPLAAAMPATSSQLCIAPDGVPLLLDRGDGSPVLRAVAYLARASRGDVARPDRSSG
jgi:hypothetical protein